jgi:hypothetical protein
MDALQGIPKVEEPLKTEQGEAVLQKTDIFRRIMWFGYNRESTWFPINVDRVNEILRMNREGNKPASLEENLAAVKIPISSLNSDLENLDKKFSTKSKKKSKNKKRRNKNRPRNNPPTQNKG